MDVLLSNHAPDVAQEQELELNKKLGLRLVWKESYERNKSEENESAEEKKSVLVQSKTEKHIKDARTPGHMKLTTVELLFLMELTMSQCPNLSFFFFSFSK